MAWEWGQRSRADSSTEQITHSLVRLSPYVVLWCAMLRYAAQIAEITVLHQADDPQKLRNYAFVHFVDRASALRAVEDSEVKRHELDGKEISVRGRKGKIRDPGDVGGGGVGM